MEQGDPSGSRQERRKEETRTKIIEAAMKLFENQGFADTTMEQIAEKADVAKKTLYNHFPVKEAILSEYVQRFVKGSGATLLEVLQKLPDTKSRIIQVLDMFLEWAAIHKEMFRIYFAYRMHKKFQLEEDPGIRSGNHDYMVEIVKMGQAAGELRPDLSIEVLANHLEIVLALVIVEMVRGKDEVSLRKSIEENADIFLDGTRNGGDACGK